MSPTSPIKVVVGSRNPVKVAAVRAVFSRLYPGCEVAGVDVTLPPHVPAMPLGEEITREGAAQRAHRALQSDPAALYGVGLEGGVTFESGRAYLQNWVAVLRRDRVLSEACSERLELPEAIGEAVRSGAELGPLMERRFGIADIGQREGAVGFLTGGLLDRQAFFEGALACALARFVHPELYGISPDPAEPPSRPAHP